MTDQPIKLNICLTLRETKCDTEKTEDALVSNVLVGNVCIY